MNTIQKNKEIVRSIYEEALNKRNLGLLDELVSEDFTGPDGEKGAAAFRKPVVGLLNAMPDSQWKLEELVAEEDKVAVRWQVHATHTGQFQHIGPTGKKVTSTGIAFFDLEDGKITHAVVHTDRLGFLQELGALPIDLTQLSGLKDKSGQVRFIDKFVVPEKSKEEFLERMEINRKFISTLPGFVEDAVYESKGEQGSFRYITIAAWESEEAFSKAREAVQAEYQKQGFNPAEMMERLGIGMDRGVFKEAIGH